MIKIKRLLTFLIALGLVLFVSGYNKLEALDGFVPIVGSNGKNVTYRGTSTEVVMPSNYNMPDVDFRAAWVSPLVSDISTYVNQTQYKAEIMRVFDVLEYYNMNAMIFHVRINNDALYESQYNPWSSFYSRNPDWDALPWIIEEAHKRGIEFHAWLNPYRVISKGYSGTLEELSKQFPKTNAASNPNNLLISTSGSNKGAVILNPGEPAVKQFLLDTIDEIVQNYDVDGIHFDDYFYIPGIDDSATFAKYNPNNLGLEDWRRAQVDDFIKSLDSALNLHNKNKNKAVQLGISPSGIWRNGDGIIRGYDDFGNAITNGSNTAGFAHYGAYLFSDTKKWIDNEWIDYIIPQNYHAFDNTAAPFADAVDWWAAVVKYKKVNLYTGIGLYMINEPGNTAWQNMKSVEAERQLIYLTKHPEIKGSTIFSFKHVAQGKAGSESFSKIKDNIWYKASLLPEIRTQSDLPIATPGNVKDLNISVTSAGFRLDWSKASNANKYAIYRSQGELTYDVSQLIDVVGDIDINGTLSYIDSSVKSGQYNYAVKPLSKTNKLGNSIEKSTKDAVSGDLLSLEKISNVVISDNTFAGESIDIRWVPIIPILGSRPNYEVYYSTDQLNWTKITSTANPVIVGPAFYTQKMKIGNYDKAYVKIIASNEIGFSESDIVLVDVKDKYPKISNLYYSGKSYNGELLTFQWTQVPKIDNLNYTLQYSSNQIDWMNVTSVNYPIYQDGIFYKQDFYLPYESKVYYFRVIAEDNYGKSISDLISIESKNYLGDINNIKINNKPVTGPIRVSLYDEMVISWDNIDGTDIKYMISASKDLQNFENIKGYILKGHTTSNETTSSYTAEIGYLYYKFYIRIDASSLEGVSYSDTYEIIVDVGFHWFDDFIKYMSTEEDIYLNELNIFN